MRGTIFNELDDEKLHKQIDFVDFEERFKIGMGGGMTNGSSDVDGLLAFPSKRFKKPENVSVLEHTRLRNIGECPTFTNNQRKVHKFKIHLRFLFVLQQSPVGNLTCRLIKSFTQSTTWI